ncbi:MAG: transposase [Alistipes senegalensis]|nr:transposase [Oxalobacter formigenes]MCM1280851.1 transposase [Alistipes senegalensis]
MARSARLILPYQPHHILQKGNNRSRIFCEEEDYLFFLRQLREAAAQYEVAVHAYLLMESRFHLLATPKDMVGLSRMMQRAGRYYVPYFNRKYGRSGTLWEGRYRTSPIEASTSFLVCCCFIEWLPVTSGVVRQLPDWRWSSYAHHAGIRQDPLIQDHRLYWDLGNTPFAREAAYSRLMAAPFSAEAGRKMELAFEYGWPVGTEGFRLELERRTAKKIRMGKRGRPPRERED